MRTLRLCVRFVLAGSSCTFFALASYLGHFVAGCFGRGQAWQATMTQAWARSLIVILGVRVEVQGEPPQGAFLLVSNHVSYVDILLLASRLRATFVAKADILSWPVFGPMVASGGTIFVDRVRHRDLLRVSQAIQRTLDQGVGVLLFPEGTSTSGAEVAPFRSSLLEPAARLEWPVSTASIQYRTLPGEAPAAEAVAWWGDMTLGPHLQDLFRMPAFEARLVFGEEPICDSDRKGLAAKLHAAVAGNLERSRAIPSDSPSGTWGHGAGHATSC